MEEGRYGYQYVDPIEQGYKRFYMTRKQHKEIFKDYGSRTTVNLDWKSKWEYYYKENKIIMHKFATLPAKILSVILYPAYVLIHGLGELNSLHREYRGVFNEKETGSFIGETFHPNTNSEAYDKIVEFIKETGQ